MVLLSSFLFVCLFSSNCLAILCFLYSSAVGWQRKRRHRHLHFRSYSLCPLSSPTLLGVNGRFSYPSLTTYRQDPFSITITGYLWIDNLGRRKSHSSWIWRLWNPRAWHQRWTLVRLSCCPNGWHKTGQAGPCTETKWKVCLGSMITYSHSGWYTAHQARN